MKNNLLSPSFLRRVALVTLCLGAVCPGFAGQIAFLKAAKGTGTWNQRARVMLVAGAPVYSVMLHMNGKICRHDLDTLQAALQNNGDAVSRALVAETIRTLGTGTLPPDGLNILANDYETDGKTDWNIEAYHDSNPHAEHPYYFEVTIEANIPAADFEDVKKVLTNQPTLNGKNVLKQAFKDDPTVVRALGL